MRRKLINHDVFSKINKDSLTYTESELNKAGDILAKALNVPNLTLHSFTEATATYETLDKSYVHSGYRLNGNNLVFENIEELVIDEESAKKSSKDVLRRMIDNLLEDKQEQASAAFEEYISMPTVRRNLAESVGGGRNLPTKKTKQLNENKRTTRFKPMATKLTKVNPRKFNEWKVLTENINSYIDYQEFGPIANQSELKRDERGNVVSVKIPTSQSRNEGKILSFDWKTLNTDVQVLRGKMKNIQEDNAFCRAMADLRQANAISNSSDMENILEAIVGKWPNLIYLTKGELAKKIGEALEIVGEKNYDDNICEFLADGILQTATNAYSDRVNRIMRLSGIELSEKSDDLYENFQRLVDIFYPALDESTHLEMQVFVDLYNALVEIHKIAGTEGNENLKSETNDYLRELYPVVNQQAQPTLELAGEVTAWLMNLIETNLETAPWNVSNTPHITVSGDHPRMAQNAKHPYNPAADFSGDWGDPAPVSDGKSYKGNLADEMRANAWGNYGGGDVWPSLQNPYVLKPFGTYTMVRGEDGADRSGESDWSRWQSGDTWPKLQNPNVPKAETPYTFKMNKGKEADLVVDK